MSIAPRLPQIIPYLFYRDVGAAVDLSLAPSVSRRRCASARPNPHEILERRLVELFHLFQVRGQKKEALALPQHERSQGAQENPPPQSGHTQPIHDRLCRT